MYLTDLSHSLQRAPSELETPTSYSVRDSQPLPVLSMSLWPVPRSRSYLRLPPLRHAPRICVGDAQVVLPLSTWQKMSDYTRRKNSSRRPFYQLPGPLCCNPSSRSCHAAPPRQQRASDQPAALDRPRRCSLLPPAAQGLWRAGEEHDNKE